LHLFLRVARVTRVTPACVDTGQRGWAPSQALSCRCLVPSDSPTKTRLLSTASPGATPHTVDVPPPRHPASTPCNLLRLPHPRTRRLAAGLQLLEHAAPNPSISRLLKALLREAPPLLQIPSLPRAYLVKTVAAMNMLQTRMVGRGCCCHRRSRFLPAAAALLQRLNDLAARC
jgi:hypothetical protein